jgi:hypothetical membrane protein
MHLTENSRMKISGLVLFAGVAQFFLLVLIAEAIYPGYSVANNYISDLGVGSTAYIFNTSIILLGIAIIISGIFLEKFSMPLRIVLILAGIGAMGVGVFPETTGSLHTYSSLIVFLMASIAPYFIIWRLRNTMSALWVILGTIGLISLILYVPGIYLGLGKGGMERLIVYPNLLWALGFGGYIIGKYGKE